jgi:ElaB/YqjD/DUF883 family membrane-anchored ribosome-binding protein
MGTETPKSQNVGAPDSDSGTAQSTLERNGEAFGQSEKAASDAYDKTARAVSETYEQAKNYTKNNPDKVILVSLGVGIGLGFLLGSRSRRSRTGRIARPMINALSEIALEFLR